MDLKRRIVESIERKIELKNEGLLEPLSLFNTSAMHSLHSRVYVG